ncbi:MAG: hypothetical protein JNN15_18820, partial [Blastocatellia bacterium]|nr:hypothetical protein [Blastocatellia bacterium]
QFSQHLIDTGKPIGTISGGEITFESALELSANAGDLLSTDYGQNTQRLQTFVQIKEMLDRAITSSAYAGEQTPSEASSSLLDEDYLSNKLQEREQWLREQLKTMANSLRPNAIQVIELQGSRLVISAWEREALLNTFLDADVDMRTARELLSRCAAIIAEINETYAYYRSQSSYAPHLSDTHLMAVNFYVMQAHQMADELQTLSNKMREAMRIEKACDLSATRQKLLDTCWKLKL